MKHKNENIVSQFATHRLNKINKNIPKKNLIIEWDVENGSFGD